VENIKTKIEATNPIQNVKNTEPRRNLPNVTPNCKIKHQHCKNNAEIKQIRPKPISKIPKGGWQTPDGNKAKGKGKRQKAIVGRQKAKGNSGTIAFCLSLLLFKIMSFAFVL
jgi:hypothetical protein